MDQAQRLLFNSWPRLVGYPEQYPVFDEGTFDAFLEAQEGNANCYSRISWLSNTGEWLLNRIFLDLDGNVPLNGVTDVELVQKLRSDSSFRQEVLGDVVEDVRTVARVCREVSFPLIGVYTGKGVHLHVMTEQRVSPERELRTNQLWLEDECSLQTFDRQVLGDIKRLSRVPNCRRYDERVSTSTDLYAIPLSRNELENITADELVSWSTNPRQIEEPGESPPPLFVRDDYLPDAEKECVHDVEPVEIGEDGIDELTEKMEMWLEDVLQLPCLYERITTRNPAHPIRFNCAIMMFNVGMKPEDVVEIYSRLGWDDFDESITRRFAQQIYERGYADMSCATLQSKGLCVYERGEREDSCHAFGYSGGIQDW